MIPLNDSLEKVRLQIQNSNQWLPGVTFWVGGNVLYLDRGGTCTGAEVCRKSSNDFKRRDFMIWKLYLNKAYFKK